MEATIICLDNSEWMRNGDFLPTRLVAQSDAVFLLSSRKTQQNAESCVSIVSMAGKGPKVHVTLSNDDSKIMNAIAAVQIGGNVDILSTLQLAQLALKHKQNKNQKQRIVLFIGSPVQASTESLVKMSQRLKKNNIAVDIVSFGETLTNTEKLQAFHEGVNNNDNSLLLNVPPGPHNLYDYLMSFPKLLNSNASGDNSNLVMGVDASLDPELAAALRMSLEEYGGGEGSTEAAAPAVAPTSDFGDQMDPELEEALRMSMMESNVVEAEVEEAGDAMDVDGDEEMDEDLEAALRMSMMENTEEGESEAPVPQPIAFDEGEEEADDAALYDDLDEEGQLALAMEMSRGTEKEEPKEEKPDSRALVQDALNDASFMDSIFDNIEGVDANDPLIQGAIKSFKEEEKKEDEKK